MAEANDRVGRIKQNLIDAGCDQQTIERCMQMIKEESYTELLPILTQHRATLLGEVRFGQKQIDCLDYLIYKIRNNK